MTMTRAKSIQKAICDCGDIGVGMASVSRLLNLGSTMADFGV